MTVFEAKKQVEKHFKEAVGNKGHAVKFYSVSNEGEILEFDGAPNQGVPGHKFKCTKNGDKITSVCLD